MKKLAKINTKTFYVFTKSKFRYSKATVNSLKLSELTNAVIYSLNRAMEIVMNKHLNLSPKLLDFFNESSSK